MHIVLSVLYSKKHSYTFRGLVPLHNACSYGHFEVTELLLKVTIHFLSEQYSSGIQYRVTGVSRCKCNVVALSDRVPIYSHEFLRRALACKLQCHY